MEELGRFRKNAPPAEDPLSPPPDNLAERAAAHRRALTNTDIADVYRLLPSGGGGGGGDDGDIAEEHVDDESQRRQQHSQKIIISGRSNIFWGATANLCSATLGAGVLSLPYAMQQTGWIVGIALMIVTALFTVISVGLIVRACTRYNLYSFESLAQHLSGPTLRRCVEACVVVFCQGCQVAYLVAIADILERADLLFRIHGATLAASRALTLTVVWTCVLLPLALLKRMRHLQSASALGMAAIGTLVFAAMIHWLTDSDEYSSGGGSGGSSNHTTNHTDDDWMVMSDHHVEVDDLSFDHLLFFSSNSSNHTNSNGTANATTPTGGHWSDLVWPANHSVVAAITACPIIFFAFSCQVNVPAIFHELPTATVSAAAAAGSSGATTTANAAVAKQTLMTSVTHMAVALCWTLYMAMAVVASADFCVVEGGSSSSNNDGKHEQNNDNNQTATATTTTNNDASSCMAPNVLSQYDLTSGIMQVAGAGMSLAVIVAFPLNVFPARVTVRGMLTRSSSSQTTSAINRRTHPRRPVDNEQLTEALLLREDNDDVDDDAEDSAENDACACEEANGSVEEDDNVETDAEEAVDTTPSNPPLESEVEAEEDSGRASWLQPIVDCLGRCSRQQQQEPRDENDDDCYHVVLTLALAGSSLALALVVPDISVIFSLLGGTTSSALGFVVPGWLGVRLGRDAASGLQSLQHRGRSDTADSEAPRMVRSNSNNSQEECDNDPAMDPEYLALQWDKSWTVWFLSWLLMLGGTAVAILTTAVTVYSLFTQ